MLNYSIDCMGNKHRKSSLAIAFKYNDKRKKKNK